MCGGVDYRVKRERYQVHFMQPNARLPVKTRSHGVKLVHWGRRGSEPGHLPVTGWARLEFVERGAWARWQPLPVKVMVDSWQGKERETGQTFWHALREHEYLQGLLVRLRGEERVYIVTVDSAKEAGIVSRMRYDRGPLIMQAGQQRRALSV